MRVVVWGYRGGVGTLRIPYKLSTYGKFRHMNSYSILMFNTTLLWYLLGNLGTINGTMLLAIPCCTRRDNVDVVML
jgi:hypothetical protein